MTRASLRVLLARLDCTIVVLDAVWLCWPTTIESLAQDVQARLARLGAVQMDEVPRPLRAWQVWRFPNQRVLTCSWTGDMYISFGDHWFSADATRFRAPLTLRIQRYLSQSEWWSELDAALDTWKS